MREKIGFGVRFFVDYAIIRSTTKGNDSGDKFPHIFVRTFALEISMFFKGRFDFHD